MALDPAISLSYQPTQAAVSPFAMALQASELQARAENTRGLAEQRRLLAEQRQSALNDQNALDRAVKPGAGLDDILAQLPGHMHAAVTKQWGDADKAASDAREAKAKAATTEADYLGTLAATVKSYNYDPQAAAIVLSHAKAQGHDTSQIEQLIGQDPSKLPAVVDSLIAASPKQRELADKEKVSAETSRHNLTTEGLTGSSQAETAAHNAATLGLTTAAQTETARHNRADEAHAAAALNQQAADTPTLTPEALDMVANNFAMTGGGLPPMGMGKAAAEVRSKIINRAAEMYKGLDLTSQKAAYAANQGSLKKLTDTKNTIGAFEKTAQKNIDLFLDQAGKIADTGSPMANTAVRFINGKMLGSPDQAAFDAARQVAINEIAKVTNGGGLSGVLSDSARKEIADFNPANATLKQTVAVVRLLKQDMGNRAAGIDEQIDALRKVIGTPPGTAKAPSTIGRFQVEVH